MTEISKFPGLAISRVAKLAEKYFQHNGDYMGQWVKPGRGWKRYFHDAIPVDSVSRLEVFSIIVNAARQNQESPRVLLSDDEWRQIFLLAMAWGHGSGYGAFRTDRVVRSMADTGKWMSELHVASVEGPVAGYEWLTQNRVKGLGPAFATKLLYFVSPENDRAPIIDALVASWLSRNQVFCNDRPISSRYFDSHEYKTYLEFVDEALLAIVEKRVDKAEVTDRGFVEYLMFQDELRYREKRKRIAPWMNDML